MILHENEKAMKIKLLYNQHLLYTGCFELKKKRKKKEKKSYYSFRQLSWLLREGNICLRRNRSPKNREVGDRAEI